MQARAVRSFWRDTGDLGCVNTENFGKKFVRLRAEITGILLVSRRL